MAEANHRLTRDERLRSFGALRRLFKEGRSEFIYPFRYMVLSEEAAESSVSVLFSTPKRFHKRANKRNLLRRRMREAYRLNKELLAQLDRPRHADIAIIYSSKEVHNYKTIEHAIRRILEAIRKSL